MYKKMKIKLNQKVTTGRSFSFCWPVIKEYHDGDIIQVIEASNLPKESNIRFWVNQDGWENDSYGFPIYSDYDFTIIN